MAEDQKTENNLINFMKCKDGTEDNLPLSSKIEKNVICMQSGEKALLEIKGSKLEAPITEAIGVSLIRLKSEITVYQLFSQEKTDPGEIIKKYVIPGRIVAEKEKKSWIEVKTLLKKQDDIYTKPQSTWELNLFIGVAVFFVLHYITHKSKIQERIKNNVEKPVEDDKNKDKNNKK